MKLIEIQNKEDEFFDKLKGEFTRDNCISLLKQLINASINNYSSLFSIDSICFAILKMCRKELLIDVNSEHLLKNYGGITNNIIKKVNFMFDGSFLYITELQDNKTAHTYKIEYFNNTGSSKWTLYIEEKMIGYEYRILDQNKNGIYIKKGSRQ